MAPPWCRLGTMSIGDLVLFMFYTTFIGGSIAGLGDLYRQIAEGGTHEELLPYENGTFTNLVRLQLQEG